VDGNKHFHPLFFLITVAGIRIMCICVCFLVHCRVRICLAPADLRLFAHSCVCVGTCMSTVMSVSVYCVDLLCLCQYLHVCKACCMKSEVEEPSAGASEFICIHSTACLSSEPILITSSSGLLQHCAYSPSLSLGEKMGCWWCIPVALILLSL